ncbi:arginine N-succinyltransferase [Litoribrevibacter albus]|uniref:Arginine N-succinyltransferase n=1 Tax=Litoribrevibacter albus TaxID=1473156 RepID=A0AA37SCN3_9GAMM|nr:arginine N-succinyltransferase [Litoribrevibacter albus]GLQ33615.1 arginine N-succinyltransferase subunit beta [Litoribrevibacter albus]
MIVIRPIEQKDLGDLLRMAQNAGSGLTTLPANEELLAAKIEASEASFSQRTDERHRFYMFALEDTEAGCIAGVCGLEAAVGLGDVWYNYRVSTTVNASSELGIHKQTPTLYLTNDMTGCSELCSLFLDADYRKGNNGRLLSKCRFLFLAQFAHLFSQKVFAEMRGYSDENGVSPFWESLGRKFFSLEFTRADYLTGVGQKSFIAELMPKYPIYLPFLSEEAQQTVGKTHDNTRPALAMLKSEGFNYNGLVDIFDAGPLVEAFVENIRAVRQSRLVTVEVGNAKPFDDTDRDPLLVSNTQYEDFRVTLFNKSSLVGKLLLINKEQAEQLQVNTGDQVRIVSLREPRLDAQKELGVKESSQTEFGVQEH